MTSLVRIVEEPKGPMYEALLRFALRHDCLFSLVWRDQSAFAVSAAAIAKNLRPALVRQTRTDEWPGTTLIGHFAIVRLYRLTATTLSMLAPADRLYAWIAPDRPEDLALYTSDGAPWLASVAHERNAFVYPDSVDLRRLAADVAGLRLVSDERP